MLKDSVIIRIKIADYELEVHGPKDWAEERVKKFVAQIRKRQAKGKK